MLKFNKTSPTILAVMAAITMSGAQAALADHDRGRVHDGHRAHHGQWNNGYRANNAGYYNNNGYYNNGYRNHPRTVKHEVRHVLNNL